MPNLLLTDITLDADLQSRAEIDHELVSEYADALVNGAQFDRIKVFFDGATNWLADGYHRWHAHKNAAVEEIAATVKQGSKQDAIRYSLSANHDNGKRRQPDDYRKAYVIACRHDLVDGADADEVKTLLQCSPRWARELTRAAREEAGRKRDEAIRAEKAKGASNRQAAKAVGVSPKTVDRAVASKRQASVLTQADPPAATGRPTARPASRDPDMTATVKAMGLSPPGTERSFAAEPEQADEPSQPMFNPEAFLLAAKNFHDPALNAWGGFIIDVEGFLEGLDADKLRGLPCARFRTEAIEAARAVVTMLNIILADLEAADVHVA